MRGYTPQAKNVHPFFFNFVYFKSTEEKIYIYTKCGKYAFSSLFHPLTIISFPQHVISLVGGRGGQTENYTPLYKFILTCMNMAGTFSLRSWAFSFNPRLQYIANRLKYQRIISINQSVKDLYIYLHLVSIIPNR